MKRKLILDVDTGGDDAVAILLAGHHPGAELVAVTVTQGNAPLSVTLDNTLRVLEAGGLAHVPVYAGASQPVGDRPTVPIPPVQSAPLPLPPTTLKPQPQDACDFLIDYYRGSNGPATTFVSIGPHTNLALVITRALLSQQSLLGRIPRIVTAAGGLNGNVTRWAEFNVLADPEATELVVNGGIPVSMLGLEVLDRAKLTTDDVARLRASGDRAAHVAATVIDFLYANGWRQGEIYDPVAAAAAIDPSLLQTQPMRVHVELQGESRGRTVIDGLSQQPNVDLGVGIDRQRYAKVLLDALP